MMVGNEITIAGDDKAGAQSLGWHPLAFAWRGGEMPEQFAERGIVIIHVGDSTPCCGGRALAGNGDVNDRRCVLLNQRAEIRDGHFNPHRRCGIRRQRRGQDACRQNRAAGRQSDRHGEFLKTAGELHGECLSRNVSLRWGLEPFQFHRCAALSAAMLKSGLRQGEPHGPDRKAANCRGLNTDIALYRHHPASYHKD